MKLVTILEVISEINVSIDNVRKTQDWVLDRFNKFNPLHTRVLKESNETIFALEEQVLRLESLL